MKRSPRTKATALGQELRRIADQYEAHAKAYARGESAHEVDPKMAAMSLGRAEGLRDAAAKVDAANGKASPLSAKELVNGLAESDRILTRELTSFEDILPPLPPLSLEQRVERLERLLLPRLPTLRPSEASPAPTSTPQPPPGKTTVATRSSPRAGDVDPLSAMERKILTALAQLGAYSRGFGSKGRRPATVEAVLLLTGYRPSGHFTAALARLRADALITGPSSALELTDVGDEMLGTFEPLPRGAELVEHWTNVLGAMAGRILRLSVNNPEGTEEAEVLSVLGYAKSGHFTRAVADLRKLSILEPRGEIKPTAEFLAVVKGGT